MKVQHYYQSFVLYVVKDIASEDESIAFSQQNYDQGSCSSVDQDEISSSENYQDDSDSCCTSESSKKSELIDSYESPISEQMYASFVPCDLITQRETVRKVSLFF